MAGAAASGARRDPAAGLQPGDTLGRYQILRELAMGGMAALYVARHVDATGFEKVIALKRVLPNLVRDENFVRMFLNEARLAATLDHSNIVHVIDFGRDGPDYFLAMEYVHGKGVHEILRATSRGPTAPLACALTIARDVAKALHYAHERTGTDGRPMGLVHRDVSPSNILVSFEGEVKLADFGIATATELTRATRTGSIKGKLSYMAPEQVKGDNLDRRADVFSLGVVLYELTTGRRCFYAPGEFALINRVVEGKFEKPSVVREGFSAELEAIIVRALQVDREARFATARELQLALEGYATSQGIQLSSVELSTFMGEVFAYEDYPQTSRVSPPLAAEPITLRTGGDKGRHRTRVRRALPALLVAGGVGAIVGLGVGVGMTLGAGDDTDPARGPVEAAAPALVPEPAPEVAPTDRVAEADDGTIEPEPEPEPEPDDVLVMDPEDEGPPAKARASTRRTKRSTKPRARATQASPPASGDVGYLPPSRRK
jgi:serine/threonine protein kinase